MSATSIVCLSLAWLPALHKVIREPAEVVARMRQERFYHPHIPPSARTQAYLYNSLLRMLFTAIFLYLFSRFDPSFHFECISLGFAKMTSQSTFLPFLFQLCSSFLAYQAARLACIMTIQRVAFALPLLLATPVALVLAVFWRDMPYFTWVS